MRIVIPSVDYADMIGATLPAWRSLFPAATLVVVTARHDRATLDAARARGADVLVTDAWYRQGRAFDKAAALDEAFDFPARELGEICIAIDADVYPFGVFTLEALAADMLYSVDRFYVDTPATLARQVARPNPGALDRMTAGRRGPGYFQAFRARRDLTFGSYPDAGFYDLAFHRQFPGGVAVLESSYVVHLGRKSGKNWRGRTLPKWGAA
jgi:hypothetical protein